VGSWELCVLKPFSFLAENYGSSDLQCREIRKGHTVGLYFDRSHNSGDVLGFRNPEGHSLGAIVGLLFVGFAVPTTNAILGRVVNDLT